MPEICLFQRRQQSRHRHRNTSFLNEIDVRVKLRVAIKSDDKSAGDFHPPALDFPYGAEQVTAGIFVLAGVLSLGSAEERGIVRALNAEEYHVKPGIAHRVKHLWDFNEVHACLCIEREGEVPFFLPFSDSG